MKRKFSGLLMIVALNACASAAYATLPTTFVTGDLLQASDVNATNTQVNTNTSNIATKTSFVRTLTVTATTNSSTNGSSLASAITSASALSPSATNPVLIKLEPGTYTLQADLTLPQYVSIEGAGDIPDAVTATSAPTTGVTTIVDGSYGFYTSGNNMIADLTISNNSSSVSSLYIGTSVASLNGPVELRNASVVQNNSSGIAIEVNGSQASGADSLFMQSSQVDTTTSTTVGAITVDSGVTGGNVEMHNSVVQTPTGIAVNLTTTPSVTSKVYVYGSEFNGTLAATVAGTQYFVVGSAGGVAGASNIAKCAFSVVYGSGALTPLSSSCQ